MTAVRDVTPHRRAPHLPEPLGDVIAAGVRHLAEDAVDRIRTNRRSAMASYVLADEAGRVFVLRESSEAEADAHPEWLVGCYHKVPSVYDLEDDLMTHYETTRFRRRRLALKAACR